jgi:hypothetical protein
MLKALVLVRKMRELSDYFGKLENSPVTLR